MLIKRNDYALFHTIESDGLDVCFKDSVGRYFLVNAEQIPSLIEDLVRMTGRLDTWSVKTDFSKLG